MRWGCVFLLFVSLVHATIFGRIQGIVHDPQHRPLGGAAVKLQAITSDYSQTTQADDNGAFSFTSVLQLLFWSTHQVVRRLISRSCCESVHAEFPPVISLGS